MCVYIHRERERERQREREKREREREERERGRERERERKRKKKFWNSCECSFQHQSTFHVSCRSCQVCAHCHDSSVNINRWLCSRAGFPPNLCSLRISISLAISLTCKRPSSSTLRPKALLLMVECCTMPSSPVSSNLEPTGEKVKQLQTNCFCRRLCTHAPEKSAPKQAPLLPQSPYR